MSEDKPINDSAQIIAPPPLVFAAGFAIGLVLEWLLPFRIFSAVPFKFTGWLLAVIAGLLALWAAWTMHRTGTNINPHRPAVALVTSGPFRFTRNPLYLSLTLLPKLNVRPYAPHPCERQRQRRS